MSVSYRVPRCKQCCFSMSASSPRCILHIDMDAFFAAVEQLDFLEHRGKPVVVGADPKAGKGRGVVSTASYEARKFGIHSAQPISQAYRLCPQAIFLPGRPQRYLEVSRQVINILRDFSPVMQQISIDEAFLDISDTARHLGGPRAVAERIKQRIREETGLTASVGMATNKFVAKVASDLHKPDGLTICEAGREKEFLAPLPVGRLWGAGRKTEERLKRLGFHTIGDVAKAPRKWLAAEFGKLGTHLWELANGIDERPVKEWGPQKSISHEHTFAEDQDDPAIIEHTLWSIADELSQDMRDAGLKGRTLTLKIRLEGFITHTRRRSLPCETNDATMMRDTAVEILRKFDRQDRKVRLLGIAMSRLNSESPPRHESLGRSDRPGKQLGLFDEVPAPPRSEKISELIDTLRNKFGEGTATRGSLLERPNEPRHMGKEQIATRGSRRKKGA